MRDVSGKEKIWGRLARLASLLEMLLEAARWNWDHAADS